MRDPEDRIYAYFPETNHAIYIEDEEMWEDWERECEGCREDIPWIRYDDLARMMKIYPNLGNIYAYEP